MEPSIVGRKVLIRYAVVLGLGYVLGSKAGRRRYEQLVGTYRALTGSPVAKSMIEGGRRKIASRISPDAGFVTLTVESFTHPGYAAIRAAIENAGGTSGGITGAQWIEAVRDQAASPLTAGLASELGVEAIQVDEEKLPRYIGGVLARLQEVWMGRQIAEVKSKLQRMSPIDQGDEYHALFGDLVAMESYRRSLLEQASGGD